MGNNPTKADRPSAKMDVKQLVEDAITSHPVVIFSKTYCPYCISAKSDIKKAGSAVANFQPPKIYELNQMGAKGRAIQAYLAEKTGRRTVPNVFIGGVTVGGGDEVSSYARRNVLKQMLTQAPERLAADAGEEKETAESVVENLIKEHPVVIFSKSWCPFCISAKREVAEASASIPGFAGAKLVELDESGDMGSQIQRYLVQKTGRNTVPNVFIGGRTVGGGDDVAGMAYRGELQAMISSVVESISPQPYQDLVKPAEVVVASVPKVGPSSSPVQELVEKAISANPVVVFSKSFCPYCKSAKETLETVGSDLPGYQAAKVFELDTMGELGEEVQRYLGEKTGQQTVPAVFVDGAFRGGSSEIVGLATEGGLAEILTSAYSSVSGDVATDEKKAPAQKTIIFGAGCFWGVELAFQRIVGVEKTEVGYSNGQFSQVSYDAVCSGRTGSAEVVKVTYNPDIISLKELLAVWEGRHDPTLLNKQGNDVGTQYRSAIFYNDVEQKEDIEEWRLEASTRHTKPIMTDIAYVKNYCVAEEYHQRYLEKKGQNAEKGSNAFIRCYG